MSVDKCNSRGQYECNVKLITKKEKGMLFYPLCYLTPPTGNTGQNK
jgi:hypothetical protein